MKCRACGAKAVIKLRSHNTAYCKPDYLHWFDKYLARTIRRFKMFQPSDRILVAVSGGKDSMALWYALTRAGYQCDGLYIAQGIGSKKRPYSERSEEVCRQMAQKLDRPLRLVRVKDEVGASVPELNQIIRRKICSVCGLSKRYLMNREAYEGGYDVLATGHNLDDEAAALFGNVMVWDMDRLGHQAPVVPQKGARLMKKVRPLCYFSEREVLAYTMLHRLTYLADECPHSVGATSITHKELLSQLEQESPGSKRRFYQEFLRRKEIFHSPGGDPELVSCSRCGMTTTAEICVYCRMVIRVAEAQNEASYQNLPQSQPEPDVQVVSIQ